jgi:hypothetical protein
MSNVRSSHGKALQVAMSASRHWGAYISLLLLVVAPFTIVGVAIGAICVGSTAPTEVARSSVSPGPSQGVVIKLGRVICGDCCVGNIWNAIGAMPGVRDIDATAGNSEFILFYDRQVTDAADVLATLVASGEEEAELAPLDPQESKTERRWVRAARPRPAR